MATSWPIPGRASPDNAFDPIASRLAETYPFDVDELDTEPLAPSTRE